jgi:hypothetical protein
MWRCSKCGKTLEDNFDTCWSCGTSQNGIEDPAFRPEEGASDEPTTQDGSTLTDAQDASELTTRSTTTDGRSDAVWSEAGLAALLLRFLGVYFAAWAIIRGMEHAMRVLLASRQVGLNSALSDYWAYLAEPLPELAVGIYLLVGGRWVYEKLLTPITANPINDTPDDIDKTSNGSCKGDKSQDRNTQ